MNDMVKNLFLWLIIAIVLVSVFSNFGPRNSVAEKLSYSQFLKEVDQGMVNSVTIEDDKIIKGITKNNKRFVTYMPMQDNALLGELLKSKVDVSGQEKQQESFLLHLFINWFPMLLLIGVWVFFMRQMQGGGGRGAMSFGRSRARLLGEDQVKVTFADVAGVDEAKDEVKELVDFLRDPTKFQNLGGRIPRGVLLVGSPGTGKTLLARAVAGEAKVPFFTISGSDFVEMFVGVGASRVRDMFEQAKKHAPCIIFIDEIDAVGRHRGAGLGGGHDEREQTLNQLLVEMDGFEGNEGVIVVAATNRPDVLDPALLRPGRFDRQVVVPLPDIRGREQILRVHLQKTPVDTNVDVMAIARGTPGFSGADLANLVNEAALFAARANKRKISMIELDNAKDKIMMGAERRSMVMDDNEKKLTAYHEAGHAIVGLCVPEHDPVYKVSIIPRGRALGVTMFLPEQDRYSHSKRRLESQLSSLFGGRIAEELIFGPESVTTGASNDIMRSTEIARKMVTTWGLSTLGPLTFGEEEEEVFLGRSMNKHKEMSDRTAQQIDDEVRAIIDRNYKRAKEILVTNMDKLHLMAQSLIKYETIDFQQIQEIMSGKEPSPPQDWGSSKPLDGSEVKNNKELPEKPIDPEVIVNPAEEH
ncbi:ATP-dependent zinc metalloprotease FtsH [Legionella longbeachae]|uniref:ATP-dependent zinc metalloprotease FtsH n=2 Tax=Legionella longbeachae TaxID=450 RepID=D3HNY7_LEGLN|nr:ATP-dependent zinc metalloprotease FtsH [Legionella longbeachae]EEZ96398.1 cell division protease FtsH [Legionella longbeachae D-4968]CBJ10600.1 Cell division protease ftsH [Legionella longbeachae NSW150]ARM34324.2 ATP-dependent zinc metalloprotease FtsH [Legionella longbeachae]QEY50137.1 ATP-dependent zinc metalloprotease FtsH [Legionella longbeachae]